MSKHTPGPWTFDVNGFKQSGELLITVPGDLVIAQVFNEMPGCEAEAMADARLIAATPLLAQSALGAYFLCESLLAVREGATDELIREIRDALKQSITIAGLELQP